MRLATFLLTFITVCLASATAFAEPFRRLVNFEWEPIPGASSYDVELQQKKENGKTFKFKVKDAVWNGRLAPGQYDMKLRSRDYRGVPGDWSPSSPVEVGLESAVLVYPRPQSTLGGRGAKDTEVVFRWQPVGGAVAYEVEVSNDDGSFAQKERISGTQWKLDLPVAREYTWKVTALGAEADVKSEAVSLAQFNLLGPKIEKPVLEKPENEFVRDVRWKRPDNAATYDVRVSRLNKEKKWEPVQTYPDLKDDTIPFDASWDGGVYKVDVKAKADRRIPSDVASGTFKVRKGDRSPAAEFNAEVRKSIDRINGWYAIASYLVTVVKYSSSNYDPSVGVGTSYSAVGGTGRIGLGYFQPDKSWGFLGVLDMSGFVNEQGKNLTYTSSEMSAVWRTPVGERGEFRSQMGLYYKEHQVAIGDLVNGTVSSYEKAVVAGPHVSGEYWYSITPKIGFQVNAHAYLGVLKLKTPNGQPIEPGLSSQMGFMGSYRFTKRLTGLMGYTRREDTVTYKSSPANPSNDGKKNKATLSGDYLNFFAEYNF